MDDVTLTGSVKFFKNDKGYGFIRLDEPYKGHDEVFVHYTKICGQNQDYKCLKQNDKVDVKLELTSQGLKATYVLVTESQPDTQQQQPHNPYNLQYGGYGRGGYNAGYDSYQNYGGGNRGWGYDRGGYERGGYDRGSYNQGGYSRGGYGYEEY